MQFSENFIAFHEIMKKSMILSIFNHKRTKSEPKMDPKCTKKVQKKGPKWPKNGRKMAEKWPKSGRKMVLKIDTTPEREKCKERKSLKNSTLKLNLISRNVLKLAIILSFLDQF